MAARKPTAPAAGPTCPTCERLAAELARLQRLERKQTAAAREYEALLRNQAAQLHHAQAFAKEASQAAEIWQSRHFTATERHKYEVLQLRQLLAAYPVPMRLLSNNFFLATIYPN